MNIENLIVNETEEDLEQSQTPVNQIVDTSKTPMNDVFLTPNNDDLVVMTPGEL